MKHPELVSRLLRDFVFIDCRLCDHPEVRASVFWKQGDRLLLSHQTAHEAVPGSHGFPIDPLTGGRTLERRAAFAADPGDNPPKSYRSFLGVPIVGSTSDAPVGVLALESTREEVLKREHLGRAQLLAALLAYAHLQISAGNRVVTPVSVSLGRALKQAREELGITQNELANRLGRSRIPLSRWEAGAQAPSVGPLLAWCEALGILSRDRPGLVQVVDVTPELLRFLRDDPGRLRDLSPEGFEALVAERLERMGFAVQLTGRTFKRDGGIDIIAVPRTPPIGAFLLAAQVKHHRGGHPTGRPAVDRLLSWKDGPFRAGLLVTNTAFTRDALWLATRDQNRAFLRLRDFEDLKRWIEDNFWSEAEWRELPEQICLAPGITVAVPKVRLSDSLTLWPLRGIDEDDSGARRRAGRITTR